MRFPSFQQGLHGEKRPETMNNYFNVSNSTLFESKLVFIQSKSTFPMAFAVTVYTLLVKREMFEEVKGFFVARLHR